MPVDGYVRAGSVLAADRGDARAPEAQSSASGVAGPEAMPGLGGDASFRRAERETIRRLRPAVESGPGEGEP